MKKIITILLVFISTYTFAQSDETGSTKNNTRYGADAEIAVIGGKGFAYSAAVEYKYTFDKSGKSGAHIAGGNIAIGGRLGDGFHVLVGGGYERNITYERGQPYAILRINTPVVLVSGKYLFSEYEKYANNYEVNAVVFPGQKIFGIGGFYHTEYDCKVWGAKLLFRFGGGSDGGSSSGTKSGGSSFCCRFF